MRNILLVLHEDISLEEFQAELQEMKDNLTTSMEYELMNGTLPRRIDLEIPKTHCEVECHHLKLIKDRLNNMTKNEGICRSHKVYNTSKELELCNVTNTCLMMDYDPTAKDFTSQLNNLKKDDKKYRRKCYDCLSKLSSTAISSKYSISN